MTFPVRLQRRDFTAFLFSVPAMATMPHPVRAGESLAPTVLVLGDSLSAEYGLPRGRGWVALLESRLTQTHPALKVVNASISGETTAGGRSRLPRLLQQHRPGLVLIELGANDGLRGLPLASTRDHLQTMVQAVRRTGAQVLLIGMELPPNYGPQHTQAFRKMFADLARREHIALVPFLLKGVADAAEPLRWFQADRIHPNEQAQARMLDNVWPELKKLLPQR